MARGLHELENRLDQLSLRLHLLLEALLGAGDDARMRLFVAHRTIALSLQLASWCPPKPRQSSSLQTGPLSLPMTIMRPFLVVRKPSGVAGSTMRSILGRRLTPLSLMKWSVMAPSSSRVCSMPANLWTLALAGLQREPYSSPRRDPLG